MVSDESPSVLSGPGRDRKVSDTYEIVPFSHAMEKPRVGAAPTSHGKEVSLWLEGRCPLDLPGSDLSVGSRCLDERHNSQRWTSTVVQEGHLQPLPCSSMNPPLPSVQRCAGGSCPPILSWPSPSVPTMPLGPPYAVMPKQLRGRGQRRRGGRKE